MSYTEYMKKAIICAVKYINNESALKIIYTLVMRLSSNPPGGRPQDF